MELPRITDLAARQAIDATRLFREFVRVRRELDTFQGSLFFKKVGDYEYLLHKVRGEVYRKGRRSPETEAQLAEFQTTKQRLKARLKLLQETVETHQRMNKAVHAGAVPTELIEVLTQLEQHGLADKSFILGSSALYAYGQSSGLKLESVKLEGRNDKLLASHPDALRVLVQSPKKEAVQQLKHSLGSLAEVEASTVRHSVWWDLKLRFVRSTSKVATKTKANSKSSKSAENALTTEARPAVLIQEKSSLSRHSPHTDVWPKLLERAPAYEQVVVGKTGKMAVMRTLAPKIYVHWECVGQLGGEMHADSEKTAQQIRLVQELLESSRLFTKLDDVANEALSNEVLALAASGEETLE